MSTIVLTDTDQGSHPLPEPSIKSWPLDGKTDETRAPDATIERPDPAQGSANGESDKFSEDLHRFLSSTSSWDPKDEEASPKWVMHDLSSLTVLNLQIVSGPLSYLTTKPGKNVRAQLLSALNFWLQVDQNSFNVIERTVTVLHNASLLIDDIQDASQRRRGFPTAHQVFGPAQTINAANYACFLAQQELSTLPNWPEAMRIFNDELLDLHRGQGMDCFWRDTMTVPTEAQYLDMVSKKTGGLFKLGARLLQSLTPTKFDVLPLTYLLGLMFQICDDYKNVFSDQMTEAKGYCEDLTEGKFSFPVIHSILNSKSENNDVVNILKLRTEDVQLKEHVVWYMRTQTKSMEYTEAVVRDLRDRLQLLLKGMGMENRLFDKIVMKILSGCLGH